MRFSSFGLALCAALLASPAAAEVVRDSSLGFSVAFPGQSTRADASKDQLAEFMSRAAIWTLSDDTASYSIDAVQLAPDYETDDLELMLSVTSPMCFNDAEDDNILITESVKFSNGLGIDSKKRRSNGIDSHYDLRRVVVKRGMLYCLRASYSTDKDGTAPLAFIKSFNLL